MNRTKIPWTERTWNPITGCTPCSIGCENCYAQAILKRFKKPTGVTLHPDRLDEPKRLRKPSRIFVCSMSDLFHEDVPPYYRCAIWLTMKNCPQHTFQILTKRPERIPSIAPALAENVWLGITIENQEATDSRIDNLLHSKAKVHFISCEPLLGPIRLPVRELADPASIDWVIVGGESGPRPRPMNPDWVRSIRDQCKTAGVPFFFKGWGDKSPQLLDGVEHKEFPA